VVANPKPHLEGSMLYSETEIHAAVKRLIQQGYAALTVRQQLIVDSLSAVC